MSEPAPSLSIQSEFRYRGPGGTWLRDAAVYSIILIIAMWWQHIYGAGPRAKLILSFFIPVVAVPAALWLRWTDITAGGDGVRIRKGRDAPVEFSFADISRVVTTSDDDGEMPYPQWLIGPAVELRLKSGKAIRVTMSERRQGEFLSYLGSRGLDIRAEAANP
jgi:hypothetical protein